MITKYYSEKIIKDKSIEAEFLFNNGTKNIKLDELKRYKDLEELSNSLYTSTLPKKQKDKIRKNFEDIKEILKNKGLKDIDGDQLITTYKRYLKSRLKNNNVIANLEYLGLVEGNQVTELGNWLGKQLDKNPKFTYFAMNDDEIKYLKYALISLYNNRTEIINNKIIKNEMELVKQNKHI